MPERRRRGSIREPGASFPGRCRCLTTPRRSGSQGREERPLSWTLHPILSWPVISRRIVTGTAERPREASLSEGSPKSLSPRASLSLAFGLHRVLGYDVASLAERLPARVKPSEVDTTPYKRAVKRLSYVHERRGPVDPPQSSAKQVAPRRRSSSRSTPDGEGWL